ncbi:hypothetical protein FFLO_00956 [Filobasidium floriforme]|uniref:RRM domain-containing protein n=1 Tax=Filobasidium floriforme TaxID=5210 RepID=A0A8K0JQK8_9TREE|nr:hypothetical protein FFLO_00956 [Filobasidium floriforme]
MNSTSAAESTTVKGGKKTIFITGFADDVKEQELLQAFVTFGDIIEISVPMDPRDQSKHRGFAFITYSSSMDAQDAIDNYDFNELPGRQGRGKYLKVNIAKPDNKAAGAGGMRGDRAVWAAEEWLVEHAKPLDESRGPDMQAPLPPGLRRAEASNNPVKEAGDVTME